MRMHAAKAVKSREAIIVARIVGTSGDRISVARTAQMMLNGSYKLYIHTYTLIRVDTYIQI